MPDNSNCGEEDRKCPQKFQSHLKICHYLDEVWQPTVTLYWNIWNSRKIILMSPKKEKLYYSKLWRKKKRGEKYPFLTTSVYLSQAYQKYHYTSKHFYLFSSTTNSQRIIHAEQKKVSEWPTFLRSVDILISISTLL